MDDWGDDTMPRLTTTKPRLAVASNPRRLAVSTTKARRITGHALQKMRLALWTKQGQKCAECGRFVEHPYGYELDHIIALVNGGSNAEENMQLLCVWFDGDGKKRGCHVEKTKRETWGQG